MSRLDGQVRAADPDRWLSSRFVADPARRADLIALYALEAELAAIPARVTQPLLAEMRFAWWAEQMDGVFAGTPRKGHPVLEALAVVVAQHSLPREPFDALIEAHIRAAHGQGTDIETLYVGPAKLAALILGGGDRSGAVEAAAHVWGLSRMGRTDEARAARGDANRALKALPAGAFPAVAHAALVDKALPEAFKRLRLVWAVARGRI